MSYYARNITGAFSSNLEHSSVTGNNDLFFVPNSFEDINFNIFNIKATDTLSPQQFYTGNFMSKNPGYTALADQSRATTVPASQYYNARNWNNNLRVIDDDEQSNRTIEDSSTRTTGGVGSRDLETIGEGPEDGQPSEGTEDAGTSEGDAGLESIEGAEEILEAGEAAESSSPWGLAAIINQQIGSVVNSAMTTQLSTQQTADYQQNINQHGVNVGVNADLIRSNEQQTINTKEAAGAFGSLLGPLGTLIGRSVVGNTPPDQSVLNTAASFQGRIDPTDTGIAQSATTVAASGTSSMQDTVDTSQ